MRIRIYIIGVAGVLMMMGGTSSTVYGLMSDAPLPVLCGIIILIGGVGNVRWAVRRM